MVFLPQTPSNEAEGSIVELEDFNLLSGEEDLESSNRLGLIAKSAEEEAQVEEAEEVTL